MTDLTSDQLAFLRAQKIPLSSVFDATGMARGDYQAVMKAERKSFAYGVSACTASGHTMKTRSGHCFQCNHARIAFMLRHDAWAHIYIAASVSGRFIKVGCAIDVEDRNNKLNRYEYGGQKDWQILATANTDSAGRIEHEAHTKLAQYSAHGNYIREGKQQKCYELFRCNFGDARDALKAALGKVVLRVPAEERALSAFNFR